MKVYVFVIITLGLMFTFHMAGIDTGSSKAIDYFGLSSTNNTVNVNPDVSITSVGTFTQIKNHLSANSFYYILIAFFIIATILSLAKVSALTLSWQPSIDAVFAVMGLIVWSIFALDTYSIIKFVGEITGNAGWIYNVVKIFLIVYLGAFAFALISFIKQGQ